MFSDDFVEQLLDDGLVAVVLPAHPFYVLSRRRLNNRQRFSLPFGVALNGAKARNAATTTVAGSRCVEKAVF